MKQTLTIELVFTQEVTFEQVPELYFWRRICRQMKQGMCLQPNQLQCLDCPMKAKCFYATVSGNDFSMAPGILLESFQVTKRHFASGEKFMLQISAIGTVGYALNFIELIFGELSTKTISFLVQNTRIQTSEVKAISKQRLQTPISTPLTIQTVEQLFTRYLPSHDVPPLEQSWQKGMQLRSGMYHDGSSRVTLGGAMGVVTDMSIIGSLVGFDEHYWLGLGKPNKNK
ncbi:MAG: hypothetical protein ACRC17_02850 [Culicoidibacterales bacterium]